MKVIDKIKNTTETLFSFELLPPVKGNHIDIVYKAIDPLIEFNPLNINITYHQQEAIYKKIDERLLEKKIIRKRPGTVAISAAIKYKYKVTVVPHLICGGFTKEETEDALIDLHFLGMHNLLALRGDPPKGEHRFIPEPGGNEYAVDLVKQIIDMNNGIYLVKDLENPHPTDFSVGVAGYPEKHFEAPNMASDLRNLKAKVDAGADYIVTQMFFENKKYFDFVDACRAAGITVPIIPGLKPITFQSDYRLLPQTFHIDIPDELSSELEKCTTNEEARQVGVEWGIAQSKELKNAGVPAIHYYTIGVSENIRKIAEAVF
ncbi:MAG: methylenetetrahydrofolate reductase [NAD(P)H] [Bacteroidales bacterium]|nr:methylenetetrahydrofolate reductase [NAD(P)H] [Bacteroidales bacterium]